MRKTIGWAAAMVALAAPLVAEPLSRGERDRAMSDLHATRKLFLDSIAGLSAEQWSWKPAPDRWSIAEVAEHVTIVEGVYWDMIQQQVAKPADPAKRSEIQVSDDEVIPRMADRTTKAQTPPAGEPKGQWADAGAVAAEFRVRRDRAIEYIKTTDDDLRGRVLTHGATGPIDMYQWFLLACGHIERHVAQINEVKGTAGYPGGE